MAESIVTGRWWALGRGDIDATVAQVGFNLAQMVIPVFLLLPVGIPVEFSVTHLLPGYALGFLVGSLGLAWPGGTSGKMSRRMCMEITFRPSSPTLFRSCCRSTWRAMTPISHGELARL